MLKCAANAATLILHYMQLGHEIVGDEGIKSFTSKVQTFVLALSKSYKVQKRVTDFYIRGSDCAKKLIELVMTKVARFI